MGATPTRDLAESNAPGSDQHQMLRVPVELNSLTLTLASISKTNPDPPSQLGPSLSKRPGEAFDMCEASGTDGTEKWSSQIIAEFDSEFIADNAVATVSPVAEPRVCVFDAPHTRTVTKLVSTDMRTLMRLRTLMR